LLPGNVIGDKGKRPGAGAKAAFQAALGEIIEQCDFLGKSDGIPQRQHVNKRPQAYPFGALGGRAEKSARTGTLGKAQVEVVFGDEIKIHPRLIGELQNIEMALIELNVGERRMIVLLHVVEQAKFHEPSSFRLILDFLSRALLYIASGPSL
jgi:hypothetical protein